MGSGCHAYAGMETADVGGVLDGSGLTPFITAYLRWKAGAPSQQAKKT